MNFIANNGVLHNQILDHLPIFTIRRKERENKDFTRVLGRSMKDYNVSHF